MDLKKIQAEISSQLIDTSKQEDAKSKAKRDHEKYLNDVREAVSTPAGRRTYWAILEKCKVFVNSYVHGDNGYGSTFNAGRQSIGQELIRDLEEARPGVVYQMALESHAEKQRNVEEA